MTDNVFGDPSTPAAVATPPVVQNDPTDLLKNIKNEAGEQKYKSLEDALIALDHSQKYIPQLKGQLTDYEKKLQEVEEKVGKFGNIEETVQRLLAKEPTQVATPPVASGLDEQAVRELVKASLESDREQSASIANFQKVNGSLVSKFGDKAVEVLDAKAAELGTTRQALGELAKQNPALVLALFPDTPSKDPSPAVSGRRTPDPRHVANSDSHKPARSLLSGPGANRRDQGAYFADLRKPIYEKYGLDS